MSEDPESVDELRCSTVMLDGDKGAALFGDEIRQRRVTFCVDTSASMHDCLDAVKAELMATLERRAQRARAGDAFNVVEFSSTVARWADEMVACTPTTVGVAARWIAELRPTTGTNTGDALLAALADATCDGVVLVTDSVPDQPADDVVDAALRAAGARPVHCRYVQRHAADRAALAFLRDLATETAGSLSVVTVSAHGRLLDVAPVYRADDSTLRTTSGNLFPADQKLCSVGTSLDGPPPGVVAAAPPWPYCLYPWPYRHYYVAAELGPMRWRAGKAWMRHTREFSDHVAAAAVPGAGAMLVGQRVLARRHRDGFFYLGTVKSQVCMAALQSFHFPVPPLLPRVRGSVAEWLACWTQAQHGLGVNRIATLSGNTLRQTVHIRRASVHQAAKLVAALFSGVVSGTTVRALVLGRFCQKKIKIEL